MPDQDADAALHFGVLGPVTAWRNGESINLGGAKLRALLAVLLLHRGELLTTQRLAACLWGVTPPSSAVKMVQVLVSRLRRTLALASGQVVLTQDRGYLLVVEESRIDVSRARALQAAGAARLADHPDAAARNFRDALELWRGEPLCDVASEPFAPSAIAQLTELRLSIVEKRITADLASGRHAELIGELRSHISDHPERDSAHASLALALYRSGRQVEALDVARDHRARMAEAYGLDPSPEIDRLELRILRHDPSLDLPPAHPSPAATPAATPAAPAQDAAPVPSDHPRQRSTWLGGRRRRIAVLGSCLIAAATAVTTAVVVSNHASPGAVGAHHTLRPNSIAVLDANTGALRADVPVGHFPGEAAVSGGLVWVSDRQDRTVTQLDASSFVTRGVVGLDDFPEAVAATPGRVWIGAGFSGRLWRGDDASHELTAPFYPDRPVAGVLTLAGTPRALWAGTGGATLVRLDPRSAAVTARVTLPMDARAITAVGDQAWAITSTGGRVYRVGSDGAFHVITTLPGQPVAIAAGSGAIWAAATPHNLYRLDPTDGHIEKRYLLNGTPSALAISRGTVWVTENPEGRLERIPAVSTAPRASFELTFPIGGLAVAGTSVWITLDAR